MEITIIKSLEQYNEYCKLVEQMTQNENSAELDKIELLTFLIEKWDSEHNTLNDASPIEILKTLMHEHQMKSKDLVELLGLTKGTVSKMMTYNCGMSKDTIRKLSEYFKVSQELFNRPYKLVNEVNRHFRNASLMNTQKNLEVAR